MSGEFSAGVDLLTGAWTRERFEAELGKAVSEAQRAGEVLSLLRFDVDDLQELNDLHGRDALDACLGWFASKLSEVIDGAGPIGRIGGDDFAVFLRKVPHERALRLAEQVRRLVPTTLHASAFGDFRLTVSIGVATHKHGEPWGNLLDAAEAACTRAKQGGRDVVVAR